MCVCVCVCVCVCLYTCVCVFVHVCVCVCLFIQCACAVHVHVCACYLVGVFSVCAVFQCDVIDTKLAQSQNTHIYERHVMHALHKAVASVEVVSPLTHTTLGAAGLRDPIILSPLTHTTLGTAGLRDLIILSSSHTVHWEQQDYGTS